MGTKIKIKDNDGIIDLARGAAVPRLGDIVHLTLKGTKDEKTYTVYNVEHVFDFNMALAIGNTTVTLEALKDIEEN